MRKTRINVLMSIAIVTLSTGLLAEIAPGAFAAASGSVPAPAFDPPSHAKSETTIFAGGCFWGVQGVFQHVKGVTSAVAGYAGGASATAHYEEVGSGETGHAESVRVTYDPVQVSYGTLLRVYFSVVADPTTLNYQGPDEGTQYRTALFPTTPAQADVAARYIAQLDKARIWHRPIVTRVERFIGFYPAEAYHQNYLTLNPDSPYIQINDLPKVTALKRDFPVLYSAKPVLVGAR